MCKCINLAHKIRMYACQHNPTHVRLSSLEQQYFKYLKILSFMMQPINLYNEIFVIWRITDAEIGRDMCACIHNSFFNATVTYMNLSVFCQLNKIWLLQNLYNIIISIYYNRFHETQISPMDPTVYPRM